MNRINSYKNSIVNNTTIIIILIILIAYITSKLISPENNNGKVQDPKLDKSYLDITGQNLY